MGEEKRLAQSEYAGAALGDQRLNTRLQKIAGTLEANPEVGFPHAMTEAELEAFYRFLSNDKVEPDRILAPHVEATRSRCEGQDTVLCVHDTTMFRSKTPREGLGQAGPCLGTCRWRSDETVFRSAYWANFRGPEAPIRCRSDDSAVSFRTMSRLYCRTNKTDGYRWCMKSSQDSRSGHDLFT